MIVLVEIWYLTVCTNVHLVDIFYYFKHILAINNEILNKKDLKNKAVDTEDIQDMAIYLYVVKPSCNF